MGGWEIDERTGRGDRERDVCNHGQPVDALRRFTNSRIALGRAGSSLADRAAVAFDLAHAQAATRCISRWMRRRCGRNSITRATAQF
jgi:ethanolamine ammonia-lyase small subunit